MMSLSSILIAVLAFQLISSTSAYATARASSDSPSSVAGEPSLTPSHLSNCVSFNPDPKIHPPSFL
jgi:hypothetical protein